MNDNDREMLKLKIQEEINRVELDIVELEKMIQPISPENSIGRISRMDAINNKSVAEAAMRNKRAKLTKLKVAEVKIDDIDFGSCVICNNSIQPMRLMYMPESNKCVRCAAR